MRIQYKAILAAAMLASSFTAIAQPVETGDFTYYASELNTEAGAISVRERIHLFAEKSCDEDFPRGSALRSRIDFKRCEIRVVKELVRQIDHPTLYKIHERTDPKSVNLKTHSTS